MGILRNELLESIDIETLSDLFAGYPVEIRIAPGGVIEFWLDDDTTAAEFAQDISEKMQEICSACLKLTVQRRLNWTSWKPKPTRRDEVFDRTRTRFPERLSRRD